MRSVYQSFIVLDEKEGKKHDRVYYPTFTFSSNSQHFAYIAKEGNKKFVVLDGKERKKYDQIWEPKFTSDSQRIIYFAQKGDEIWKIVKKIGG